MPRRLHKTLIDYLVIAVSPALIMALVGSLVFFLIEVFYRGNFQGRLQYIFALFVIGAVLIARISIEDGRERAALFALPLGIAVLLAINKFVVFQGSLLDPLTSLINLGLIALIWWSADKLTWDCTLIDEEEEDSGEGLLETVGLDSPGKAALQKEIAPASEQEATTSSDERAKSWWVRFVERRRRPHAPGVWVVYFSLAAVALFGIGQLFIPSGDMAARRRAFQLLFVYTASGLCLLVTTSFLGLRRYLRQRRMEMPTAMVNLWLILGVGLIAGVMLATMLIPRPNAEYAVSEPPFRIGSPDQKSSRHGMGPDEVEEDKDWARGKPSDEPSDRTVDSSSDEQKTQSAGEGQSEKRQSDKAQQGKDGGESSDSKSQRKNEEGKPESDKDNQSASERSAESETEASDSEKSKSADSSQSKRDSGQNPPSRPPRSWTPPKFNGEFIANILKWIIYGVLLAAIAYAVWKNRTQLAEAWRDFWRRLLDFWHGLFGGRADRSGSTAESELAASEVQRRFSDYFNPFSTAAAGEWPPVELVRYTFEALEAWAVEHGCPRLSEQTPLEFTNRLATNLPASSDDLRLLAELYCQAAYTENELPPTGLSRLSRLWSNLGAGGQNRATNVYRESGS